MANEEIRHAVRNARLDLEMTQADLADQAGVSRQWIAGLESGRMANPRLSSITAVLEVLGLTLVVQSAVPETQDRPSLQLTRTVAARPRPSVDESSILQAVLDQNRSLAAQPAGEYTLKSGARAIADQLNAVAGQRVDSSAISDALYAMKNATTPNGDAITRAISAMKGTRAIDNAAIARALEVMKAESAMRRSANAKPGAS